MKYKILGKSLLKVSEIAFGCMSLSTDHATNSIMINRALDNGITLFDTADLYQNGENEMTLGRALKGKREKAIISTKVGNQMRPDGSGWDWNPHKDYILNAVEDSLKRLQTDYIDIYMLHGGTIYDPIDDTIEAFEQLKQQGKILEYGISSIRPNVIREYVKRSSIACVMMQYSLLDRRPEECCLDLLYENNISVLARGTLAKGMLINKLANNYLTYSMEEVASMKAAVSNVAGHQRSSTEVAVGYVLSHPAVASAVLGIRTSAQLEEAIRLGNRKELNREEVNALKNVIKANKYEEHR